MTHCRASSFAAGAYTVIEDMGTASSAVTLSAAASASMTVNYTAGGNSGQLTFAPGVTSRTFLVTIVNDLKDEPNEVIALALASPANATLGARPTATLTVVDNDPPPSVSFAAGAYTVTENVGTATLTVTSSAASGYTVTVNYTAGSNSGQLTFAPGAITRTIPIAIVDDLNNKPNEVIALALASPANATLGARPTATLTVGGQ